MLRRTRSFGNWSPPPTTPRPRGHPLGGGRSGTGPPTPPTASGKTTLAFDAGKSHGARRSSTRGAARTPAPCPGRPSRRARVASSEWWTRAPTTAATTTPAPRAPRIVPTSCPRRYLPRLPRTLPRLHFHRPRHPLPPGRPRRPPTPSCERSRGAASQPSPTSISSSLTRASDQSSRTSIATIIPSILSPSMPPVSPTRPPTRRTRPPRTRR